MASSPVPLWAQEMSPYHRGPTGGGVLVLAVVAVLVALALQVGVTTDGGSSVRGQACRDLRRLEAMGVQSGSNHRVLEGLCHGR